MHIGVLGGTGPAGRALAVRLASVGLEVTIGSRSRERAAEICAELRDALARPRPAAPGAATTPTPPPPTSSSSPRRGTPPPRRRRRWPSSSIGKVVVSMANALARVGKEFMPLIPPRGSVAAGVQAAVPGALVAAALHHVPARELGRHLDHDLDCDVLVCSDHPEATEATAELIDKIPGLRALDAGRLSSASADRGVDRGPAAAQLPLQDPRRRSASPHRLAMTWSDAAVRHGPQAVVAFEPGPVVTMYTCGITPYDAAHLGHAATYLTYDVLQRRLRDLGHETQCVRNVTDVDDDILAQGPRARRQLPRPGRRGDGPLRRRHEGARPAPGVQRAAGHLGHPRHPRLHRHGARVRPRLPGRRRRVLRRVVVRPLRPGEPPRPGRDAAAGGRAAAAAPTTPTSATRSTSCCGSRRRPTSRRGTRCGARAGPAGTSSARRWPCASSAPPSTCTAAAPT